jgi:hypothetical protein
MPGELCAVPSHITGTPKTKGTPPRIQIEAAALSEFVSHDVSGHVRGTLDHRDSGAL